MNWDEDQGAGEYPNAYFFYMPRMCNHCTKPCCVEACPHGAMYKRDDFGVVLRDEDLCRGAQRCIQACPYKKIYFNAVRQVSQHCIGCFPRIEKGVAPACARQCPGAPSSSASCDETKGAVHKLVDRDKVALPLHPEWNTEPNVFYVPPLSRVRRAPRRHHRRVAAPHPAFVSRITVRLGCGPGAAHARRATSAKRQRGEPSELIETLIAYKWKEVLGPFTATRRRSYGHVKSQRR